MFSNTTLVIMKRMCQNADTSSLFLLCSNRIAAFTKPYILLHRHILQTPTRNRGYIRNISIGEFLMTNVVRVHAGT